MSYEVDYISWLERQKERLTFKYNKMKAEKEQLREEFDYRNQSYMKLYEENEQLKEERESMISDYQRKLYLISILKEENKKLKDRLDD